jgi:hypothetical protein
VGPRRASLILALLIAFAGLPAGLALAAPALRTITYAGVRVHVPAGWPVYDLAREPTVCVRFDRHAVYLGTPGAGQRCPVHVLGRTEALSLAPASRAGLAPGGTNAGRLVVHGVALTATWGTRPALIERALGLGSLAQLRAAPRRGLVRAALRAATTGGSAPGAVFTGLGFDACATPSSAQMTAWASSPYRAVGVYIGGANMACAQANLTASWVAATSGAGWHLIPIYVGLQAPGNSCGCAAIAPASAAAEGTAAAQDAVAQAQSIGLGVGNPVYDDMEAYPRGSATPTVLAFLGAWTTELHALGYRAGVYSSDASGIADLVAQMGSAFAEPDVIWMANWNGAANTLDSTVPAADWATHSRLHQYQGALNATYGGVTLSIDADAVDAATAAAGSATTGGPSLVASAPPAVTGAPVAGGTLTETHATWSATPTAYSDTWEDCDTTGANCVPILGATGASYVLGAGDVGHTVRALESALAGSQSGGPAISAATTVVTAAPPSNLTAPALAAPPVAGTPVSAVAGQWSVAGSVLSNAWERCDARGANCASIPGASGSYTPTASDVGDTLRVVETASVAGLAASTTSAASAPVAPAPAGYWLFTGAGSVYGGAAEPYLGSPAARRVAHPGLVGMASTPDGRGYWLLGASGTVYSYGDAARSRALRLPHPAAGILTAPRGGYWVFTHHGNVVPGAGARWYGSPAAAGLRTASIVGMAATRDGRGYWLLTSLGTVLAYGDAGHGRTSWHLHGVVGMVTGPAGGYWLITSWGGIYRTGAATWYGSPYSSRATSSRILAMAATPDGHGYWVLNAAGSVLAYGDAPSFPAVGQTQPIAGIAPAR